MLSPLEQLLTSLAARRWQQPEFVLEAKATRARPESSIVQEKDTLWLWEIVAAVALAERLMRRSRS